MGWSDHDSHSLKLCTTAGQGGREFRSRKKGVAGKRCSKTQVFFLLPYSGLIGNKLNWFPQVKSALPMTATSEKSLSPLNSTLEPFAVFFLPCPAGE